MPVQPFPKTPRDAELKGGKNIKTFFGRDFVQDKFLISVPAPKHHYHEFVTFCRAPCTQTASLTQVNLKRTVRP